VDGRILHHLVDGLSFDNPSIYTVSELPIVTGWKADGNSFRKWSTLLRARSRCKVSFQTWPWQVLLQVNFWDGLACLTPWGAFLTHWDCSSGYEARANRCGGFTKEITFWKAKKSGFGPGELLASDRGLCVLASHWLCRSIIACSISGVIMGTYGKIMGR